MDNLKTILFVCTGNTCRSSMAAAMAEKKLPEGTGDGTGIRIISAGTAAFDGCPASSPALSVMKEQEIDLSGHRSIRLTSDLIKEADYIFTMTVRQKMQVLDLDPGAGKKVFTLKEFTMTGDPRGVDIDDPYGGSEETYRKCAAELEEAIIRMWKKLFAKNKGKNAFM